MRRTREDKAETHTAILAKASRLFRERGVEGASVGDVMAEAGLTHGGFYRHFDNKEALVAASIRAAFDSFTDAIDQRAAIVGRERAVKDYFDYYLSNDHLTHPGLGCPAPTLGPDVARAPDALKAEFGAGLNRTLAAFVKGLPGDEAANRAAATREFAFRVGAILLARASDPATAADILEACREPREGATR